MNRLKITILSLSLITVMAGAAASPALGEIREQFYNVKDIYIQLIVSLPPVFIFLTTLFFTRLANRMTSKHIAYLGLALYLIGGLGAGAVNSIFALLAFRAVLGIGVGLIMPLSTGLISFLFTKEEQSELMGYSSAMNNLGGIIAIMLSGWLVTFNWRYTFMVYLLGLVCVILVNLFLPDINLRTRKNRISFQLLKEIYPYALSIFILMLIFYTIPANFSEIASKENIVPKSLIGVIMSIQTFGAFIIGLFLKQVIAVFPRTIKYFSGLFMFLGFFILYLSVNLVLVILALFLIGLALGLGVPIYNSQVSMKVLKEETPSAMALMSSMLYLGQFVSPFVNNALVYLFAIKTTSAPFFAASLISLLFLAGLIRLPVRFIKKTN